MSVSVARVSGKVIFDVKLSGCVFLQRPLKRVPLMSVLTEFYYIRNVVT